MNDPSTSKNITGFWGKMEKDQPYQVMKQDILDNLESWFTNTPQYYSPIPIPTKLRLYTHQSSHQVLCELVNSQMNKDPDSKIVLIRNVQYRPIKGQVPRLAYTLGVFWTDSVQVDQQLMSLFFLKHGAYLGGLGRKLLVKEGATPPAGRWKKSFPEILWRIRTA